MKNKIEFIENERTVLKFKMDVNSFLGSYSHEDKLLTLEWNPTYGADEVEGVSLLDAREEEVVDYKYGGQLAAYCITVRLDSRRLGRIYLYRNARIGHINAYPVAEGTAGAYHVLVLRDVSPVGMADVFSASTFEEVKKIIINSIDKLVVIFIDELAGGEK
jgi:hypothetical protein